MAVKVFIAGVTGYMGSRLCRELIRRRHEVRGLVRAGSESRVPEGCLPVRGDALDHKTFTEGLAGVHTFVQLIGVAHPSPTKAQDFRQIDLKSCEESLAAATANKIQHFVYVSVAHPAPVMKAYIEVRTRCEELIVRSGLHATILRPWYVLGPGHYWPYFLVPFYAAAQHIRPLRDTAERLGLVTVSQMIGALVCAIELPAEGLRVIEVPEIKRLRPLGRKP
jgi:uncharacterized protein YbjT (DUF2867 family)